MEDESLLAEGLIQSVNQLAEEIRVELSHEKPSSTINVFREFGYEKQIEELKSQIEQLIAALQRRVPGLSDLTKQKDRDAIADRLKIEVAAINSLISSLLEALDRLDSLAELIQIRTESSSKQPNQMISKVRRWASALRRWILKLGGQLWNLLSRYLTLKEWKVSGKVGSGPFGFADASIELTFGP